MLVATDQRLAQTADVHIDRALVDKSITPPHPVEELRARQHAAGAFHEKLQQTELGGAEAHLAQDPSAALPAVQRSPLIGGPMDIFSASIRCCQKGGYTC